MSESPEIAGLLYKKRGGFGKMMPNAWQYRFFTVTKEGILQYFDTEIPDAEVLDSKARGRLDLRSVLEVTTEGIEGAPTGYPIQISIPSEERWKLCAETQEDQTRWCKILEKFSSKKSKTILPTPRLDSEIEKLKSPSTNSDPYNSSNENPGNLTTTNELVASNPTIQTLSPTPSSPLLASQNSTPIAVVESKHLATHPVKATAHQKSSKKRLKLAAQRAFLGQEWSEWLLVVIILNISYFGILVAQNIMSKIFFIVVGNFIIGYTLNFRSNRVEKSGEVKNTNISVNSSPLTTTSVAIRSENESPQSISDLDVSETVICKSPSSTKPIPGQTYQRADVDPRSAPPHTWSFVDSKQFNVRVGPDYNRFKRKGPSSSPFYEPFAVDVFWLVFCSLSL